MYLMVIELLEIHDVNCPHPPDLKDGLICNYCLQESPTIRVEMRTVATSWHVLTSTFAGMMMNASRKKICLSV